MLFETHRKLYEQCQTLKHALAEKDKVVHDLELQLSARPIVPPDNFISVFRQFQEEVLGDQPYPDNKVPEAAWLTPPTVGEYDERA
jgi:hypothetical protein